MRRSVFAPGLVPAAVVCIGFAGSLGGCQAPHGAALAMRPELMARSECGPDVTTDGQGDYDVSPSRDASGYTDPADIGCALNHMRAGGVTTLGAGDFYLADGVLVTDVRGTFRGAGRDLTTLHALNDFDADLCGPGDNGYPGAPSARLGWISGYMVDFFYDHQVYSGALTVTDLAVTADGDAMAYCDHGRPVYDTVYDGIGADADVGTPEHYAPSLAFDMDFTFEHLKATGQVHPAFYLGTNLTFPYEVSIETSGDVKMGDIVADSVGNPAFVGYTDGAHVVIGGSAADAIVSHDDGFTSGGSHPFGDNDIEISHVVANGTVRGIYLPTRYPGNTVSITNNTLEGVQSYGVLAQTFDPDDSCCTSFDVSHNVIGSTTGLSFGIGMSDWSFIDTGVRAMAADVYSNSIDMSSPLAGIYGQGVQDMVISNNTITGQLRDAIFVSGVAEPMHDCALLGNDVQNVQAVSSPYLTWIPPTQIFLGWGAENCTVVGGSNTTNVIDDGQDDILTGVNVQAQGQTLGSDVQDAMASLLGPQAAGYGPADRP